jgi:thiamin-phosphate kinase
MVISTDAMVEGVHFLADENPTLIAKRLLRTSLSDLAAKAARPFGYFLTTAWPPSRNWAYRQGFARGLAEDGDEFGVSLLGGDTVSTEGPLTVSATVLGWSPSGQTILRSGAHDGDLAIVCGVIGDGWLGLKAARGEIADPGGRLAMHYRPCSTCARSWRLTPARRPMCPMDCLQTRFTSPTRADWASSSHLKRCPFRSAPRIGARIRGVNCAPASTWRGEAMTTP